MTSDQHQPRLDLAAVRARLEGQRGPQFWRSLEELAETDAFQTFLQQEFPRQSIGLNGAMSRRNFLKLMGASLALAGLTGCTTAPPQKIVPYVRAPENVVPGKPLFFATAMPFNGYGLGLLAESHLGRPTKVEGNPQHPASLGATNSFAQAAVLSLYDPDRSQAVLYLGRISTWEAFLGALAGQLQAQRLSGGAGLRLLTETVTSPTLAAQIQALLEQFPQARWYQYQPINDDNAFEGARLAFGEPVNTVYRFDRADRILSLDADFLFAEPGHLRYARDFADKRRVRADRAEMNRLYVAESSPTVTGSMADHRWPMRASDIPLLARALAARLGVAGVSDGGLPANFSEEWLDALVRDLQSARGASLVLAGRHQPPAVHALVHAINAALGNVGQTVIYTEPVEANPVNQTEQLRQLVQEMNAGQVSMLVILGGNPVYYAPADLQFEQALQKVAFRVHMGLYADETAALCQWHVPETHFLETWSDVRAFDGTASIIQPLILPLYENKSAHELLAAMLNQTGQSTYDIVRAYWQGQNLPGDFEQTWQQAVHDGVVPNTASPPRQVSLRGEAVAQAAAQIAAVPADQLELVFQPDTTIWDGRFANNGWLQELPKQISKLTWDNAVLLSPATAERLGVTNHDLVELRLGNQRVRGAVWISPGHADNSVTVTLGYGRVLGGRVADELGYNAYLLRTTAAPWIAGGVALTSTGEQYRLAATQDHYALSQQGRELVRAGTLEEFIEHPDFVHEGGAHGPAPAEGEHEPGTEKTEEHIPSLYPEYDYSQGYAWAMVIDLNTCIGCGACTIACMAENNIPIVGKDEVLNGREMHWIAIDQYFEGDPSNPRIYNQPRPCMHCEKAPCEPVCPVNATVHSPEGLNSMVYNRCVGTRYCSNNCPYKVRRFNFLDYQQRDIPVLKLWRNPDVTVRARGVMEKCTYCIQRINQARYQAERENRSIREGDILTACQQVCPTQAIVFGNLNDPNSQVRQLKDQPHNYGMLAEELGTRPRTTYLAKLRNPNPELRTE